MVSHPHIMARRITRRCSVKPGGLSDQVTRNSLFRYSSPIGCGQSPSACERQAPPWSQISRHIRQPSSPGWYRRTWCRWEVASRNERSRQTYYPQSIEERRSRTHVRRVSLSLHFQHDDVAAPPAPSRSSDVSRGTSADFSRVVGPIPRSLGWKRNSGSSKPPARLPSHLRP